ncbi:MAG: exodeoxyribonuclease VII small subunit [bacterium]|nr:exodeoxyribonuclease VII small subunit [bacterium]
MKENKTYREIFSSLEDKVRTLGGPNLELEDAVKIFKEAKELYNECKKRIEKMDGEIKRIARADDGSITENAVSEDGQRI